MRAANEVTRGLSLRTYCGALGFLAAIPIFNQIDVGWNLSLLWPAILAAPVIYGMHAIPPHAAPLLLCLFLIFIKFACVGAPEPVVRYGIYLGFATAVLVAFDRRNIDLFFAGLEAGLLCNGAFAIIQMAGLLSGAYDAVLPVELWNPSLWHANPGGGMFTALPRVSGFANEPAYLGILIVVAAAYRLLVRGRPVMTGLYGLLFWSAILLLVNSRTAFVAAVWLAGCALVTRARNHAGFRTICAAVFLASFVVLPLAIIARVGFDIDYDALMLEDISVFARAVPLAWIVDANNLSFWNYVLGVGNYRSYATLVNMPPWSFAAMAAQGVLLDSKSLGGAYFFDLGFAGLTALVVAVFVICKGAPQRLLFVSTINIAFFNVYAFSWPLFWLAILSVAFRSTVESDRAFSVN